MCSAIHLIHGDGDIQNSFRTEQGRGAWKWVERIRKYRSKNIEVPVEIVGRATNHFVFMILCNGTVVYSLWNLISDVTDEFNRRKG